MKNLKKILLFLFIIILLIIISMITLKTGIQSYLFVDDKVTSARNIVVENWSGELAMFKQAKLIAEELGCLTIGTIIYKDDYSDAKKKNIFLDKCESAGINRDSVILIPVEKKNPNTLNNAIAVIEAIRQHGWNELTLVTPFHHSSRSKKVYSLVGKSYNIKVKVVAIPSFCGANEENWFLKPRGWMLVTIELVRNLYYELLVYPKY